VIDRLVVLGATGDLTARYLLPALAALHRGTHLGDGFRLTAVGRYDWRDDEFHRWARSQLDQHASDLPAGARDAVVATAEYRRADVTDPATLTDILSGAAPIAAYLALPPSSSPRPSRRSTRPASRRAARSCWKSRSVRASRKRSS